MSRAPLRVVQWATGNIGGRALREVIRHPELDLVGVLVYDAAKDGVDAGELCGEEPDRCRGDDGPRRDPRHRAGLRALHAAARSTIDDVVALLECGDQRRDDVRRAVRRRPTRSATSGGRACVDACARGNASIYSTGSSPGFITDALPFALLSLQRRVDWIEIEEFADLSQRDSPHLLFELMGYGRPVESFDPSGRQHCSTRSARRSRCWPTRRDGRSTSGRASSHE